MYSFVRFYVFLTKGHSDEDNNIFFCCISIASYRIVIRGHLCQWWCNVHCSQHVINLPMDRTTDVYDGDYLDDAVFQNVRHQLNCLAKQYNKRKEYTNGKSLHITLQLSTSTRKPWIASIKKYKKKKQNVTWMDVTRMPYVRAAAGQARKTQRSRLTLRAIRCTFCFFVCLLADDSMRTMSWCLTHTHTHTVRNYNALWQNVRSILLFSVCIRDSREQRHYSPFRCRAHMRTVSW